MTGDGFAAASPDRSGVLYLTTPDDRGIVEAPMLAPHLEVREIKIPAATSTTLLVSETYNGALYGQRYADILPLLDGSRSRHEICAALEDRHQPIEVQTALVAMASKGYIVSSEFSMSREMAAFWCTLGVSPRYAEDRFVATPTTVEGDDGRLAEALASSGVTVVADDPALAVYVTPDYIDARHGETNRSHLTSGVPWVLVKTDGVRPLFGPVFRPAEDGPCWACLEHRVRGNDEISNFLMASSGGGGAVLPRAIVPPLADAIRGLAAVEIAKWIVLGDHATIGGHAISVDSFFLADGIHPVRHRPQCRVCGDEGLWSPDRPPAPVELRPSPKPVRNSGGLRSVPPAETVRNYRHLVSPVSGVVTELIRTTDEDDSWLHVYWAGSNLALMNDSLRLLRTSLRSKSSGKGSTPEQAEASALCEAVERYSGAYQGDEIRRRGRLVDFAESEAIHPNEIQLFSDWQYDNAETINGFGSRFNYVPARFDPEVEMDWSPVWSMTAGEPRWLPTQMLYYATPIEGGVVYCGPDSNGCAAGNTLEEAILQGFFELAERDAFACWWYNRVSLPELDLDGFDDPYLSGARDYYREYNREIWVLDATNDLGVPVFVAVSRRTDKEVEDILYAAGAHFDPQIAALRAVCEMNQYLGVVRDVGTDGGNYGGKYVFDDPESLWWWQNVKLADHTWLAPDRSVAVRGKADYSPPDTADVREDVEFCRALVEGKGMEFMVLDQTRPDVAMPVAKTIVPGLRHFWARFGPGRLYDVPVRMGWREAPTLEADLNPIAVFI